MVEEYEKQEAANEADGVANGLDQSDLVSTLIICKFQKITIDIKNENQKLSKFEIVLLHFIINSVIPV